MARALHVIVDLDGTLANVDHRRHLITGRRRDFRKFHELCEKDVPNEWCVKLINGFRAVGCRIILLSGRSQAVEAQTRRWLADVFESLDGIELALLRAPLDSTPDVVLKKDWVEAFGVDKIMVAIDDRQRVVDMFRGLGITCLQCADWDDAPRANALKLSEFRGRA